MYKNLINKYHVAAPRYTSYPTVPYWNEAPPTLTEWKESVITSFNKTNHQEGISLYIHLPYCESLCTYCGCNTRITKNHRVELPYIEAVLKEWGLYQSLFKQKPVIREIHLGGGTPTFFSPEHLHFLISGILKNTIVHPDAEFSFEAHPANTTLAHLQTLYDLGFKRLSLGIQDFDPQVQLIINRIQSYRDVEQVVKQARSVGYTSVNFDLIYGLPLQKYESLKQTIEQVALLKPDRIAFYSYAHVPWVKPGQRKFTEEHLPSVAEKQELYELGRTIFKASGYEDIGMDHFALPSDSLYIAHTSGTLHRNFMGYTHQYTGLMIGLGVSSISDTGTAFAQNIKKVEEYIHAIDQGMLPIFKGHILSDEDRIIRKHILHIMCQGKTVWTNDLKHYPVLKDALARLIFMERDGLVMVDEHHLEVTDIGKRFLRNIGMALDARLWNKKSEQQLFSMAG